MDGWIDDSPATPHKALGLTRSMHQRTFRALDLPFLFFSFLSPRITNWIPPAPLFFRALHFQPASHQALLVSLNPFSGFAEVLQHALFVYFLIPLRVRIRRWPWMLVWLESRDYGIFIERD